MALEKEDGNAHYRSGDFVAAIKSYTRCLGYNARNSIVLSNRAMCYLKRKEFAKAEEDCNLALQLDAKHIKSYVRRASARNALGRHREALLDLEMASQLEPHNKQVQSEMRKTRELMKTAIKRAPKQNVLIQEINSEVYESKMEKTVELTRSPSDDSPPAPAAVTSKISKPLLVALPRLPEKAPKTALEFARFWSKVKEHATPEALDLRAAYLKV